MTRIEPAFRVDVAPRQAVLLHSVFIYGERSETLDAASRSFDEGRLSFLDGRVLAAARYTQVLHRSRDLTMIGGLILALAAAARVSGESFTPFAWTLITLAPAIIFAARTWPATSRLRVIDHEARRVYEEQRLIEMRQHWLQRATRIVPVLQRALISKSAAATSAGSDDVNDAIKRVLKAERKLKARMYSRRYATLNLTNGGWTFGAQLLRRTLAAAEIAAAANAIAFGISGQAGPAIFSGAVTSVFAAACYAFSKSWVDRRAQLVSRLALWNKQRELMADLDKTIRANADALASLYEQRTVIDLRN